jgi:alkylation response protein AidB-like acyl-CoA dehydrogenase
LKASTRPVCDILKTLAMGDPSVALVCAMHPVVLAYWLTQETAPEPYTERWRVQRLFVARTALSGAFWGTITSEPGSGGDVSRTRALARKASDGRYFITGRKHFASGAGILRFMITTAVPEGENAAAVFFVDLQGAGWDGSNGLRLLAEWDGHGMAATQSHSFEFIDYPAERIAMDGPQVGSGGAGIVGMAAFTAVIVGTVASAVGAARTQMRARKADFGPFALAEWVRVETEAWLIERAYDGMLYAIAEYGEQASRDVLLAKTAIAELAESVTQRICRAIGGGTFHRASHYGAAFEDVRALGFLRPPWGLACDQILSATIS